MWPMSAEPTHRVGLRRLAARGSVVNAVFLVAISLLGLVKGFVVAGFLSRQDYGLWGLLAASLGSLGLLKQFGIVDRYVQQAEADQELAFQRAFTLEAIFSLLFLLIGLAAVPLLAWAYGRPELLAPGLALMLVVPGTLLQSPLWIFYRRMQFARQRAFGAVDPIVEFVVTIALAAAGARYWSLIGGALAGNYASAAVIVRASPYRLAWRFSRAAARQYVSFSWPLVVSSAGVLLITQGAVIVGTAALGLAGVGAIALASSIVTYTTQVDQIVSAALYPVICAVRDRPAALLDSFAKSNRLGLMWGVPLGAGIALFAHDLIRFGLGEHWHSAIGLIQVFGLIAAFDQIGYNWDDYYRAMARTRPIAIVTTVTTIAFVAVALPLLALDGLRGFGEGMAITALVGLAGRVLYLARLFPALDIVRHAARSLLPTIPAALAVLALRTIDGRRPLRLALLELAAYVALTVAGTLLFERALLRELLGYLLPARRLPEPPASSR